MIFNYRYLNFYTFILLTAFVAFDNATFCSNLTSTDDQDTPCFLEPPTINPSRLTSSGNSLVLPCYVARSKRSTVEWWYEDFQKTVIIKLYPVFPAVRPTVLRFLTSSSPVTQNSTETDIVDVSILLRYVNVDDSGIYRCVIRPWVSNPLANVEEIPPEHDLKKHSLAYHVELYGPRLCQTSLSPLPCFSNMRTSSPTIIDAYQTAFLQCVVHNHNRPVSVFWVVGNASVNSVLITDYLPTNQHKGDQLRRIFPLSPFDYSIELTINRDVNERTYSCVIDGATDAETTLFTYIVRSIDLNAASEKTIKAHKNETIVAKEPEPEKSLPKAEKLVPHDVLTHKQVDELRKKKPHETTTKAEKSDSFENDLVELEEKTKKD